MKPCSDHQKAGNAAGYASAYYEGEYSMQHRVAYCKHNGVSLASIRGRVVRHTCDNPRCIEGTHLILGTQQDNMDDMAERGRANRTGWHAVDHSQIDYCKGESKPNAVWTDAKVLECRALYATGEYKQTELARKYGCRQTDISRIVNRKAWKHI